MNRRLSITIDSDWQQQLRDAAVLAEKGIETGQYQGEYLNFATPALFFGQMTAHRWNILTCLLGHGAVGVRELARQLGREVKRVHEDTKVLVELGLLEKNGRGALSCPYEHIHIDMSLTPPALAKAA